ncbi:hypothetical protein ACOME3_009207 [Neoechinorhynchus agilis]
MQLSRSHSLPANHLFYTHAQVDNVSGLCSALVRLMLSSWWIDCVEEAGLQRYNVSLMRVSIFAPFFKVFLTFLNSLSRSFFVLLFLIILRSICPLVSTISESAMNN